MALTLRFFSSDSAIRPAEQLPVFTRGCGPAKITVSGQVPAPRMIASCAGGGRGLAASITGGSVASTHRRARLGEE